jgi:hypothetical protein
MLHLFRSIFGSAEEPTPHPAELINRAIERAVDGTDSRLRALSGYQKTLRPAVIHALDHVITLADSLPAVLDLTACTFGDDPETSAYFVSLEHLHEVLERDAMFNQWLDSAEGAAADDIVVLLLMTLTERKVLGVALEGETLRHDVAQTTVSFSRHRLVDPASTEEETRRLLKRRAFDQLLTLALASIGTVLADRRELERERDLLRRKRAALTAGRWGLDEAHEPPPDPRTLQRQLEEIETQLRTVGAGPGLLTAHLGRLIDVLMQAERHLWAQRRAVVVDRMGIKQSAATDLAPELDLTGLHNSSGQVLIARLIRIGRDVRPQRRDLLREAERYLG